MHRILFVESGTTGGGSFESLYQHLRVINRLRFHPVVVYLNENYFVNPIMELGIPVYVLTDWMYSRHTSKCVRRMFSRLGKAFDRRLPSLYLGFRRFVHRPLLRSLQEIIESHNIHLIHLNVQTNRDLYGLFIAERMGLACISHLRSMNSGAFDKRRATYANAIVSAYIANSETTRAHWEGKGLDCRKMYLIHNGITLDTVKPFDIRTEFPISRSASIVIGYVAQMNSERRGHEFLLKAFARFLGKHPNSILMLVGDGAQRGRLTKMACRLGADRRVVFTGFRKKAKEIIRSLDVFVIPSQVDSFGRVVLEAMVVGTPVVATDVGSIREVVKDGHNGLLIKYGDVEGFRGTMERLLIDKELREKLVQNGYRTVLERFSIERYAVDIERIYESVLSE